MNNPVVEIYLSGLVNALAFEVQSDLVGRYGDSARVKVELLPREDSDDVITFHVCNNSSSSGLFFHRLTRLAVFRDFCASDFKGYELRFMDDGFSGVFFEFYPSAYE